jgi:hypothetical protein
MHRSVAIAACFLLTATIASAQPAPPSLTPTFKIIGGTNQAKGEIQFKQVDYKIVIVTFQKKVIENGKTIVVDVTEAKYVPYFTLTTIAAANTRVITPDGKQLPIDEVWKRLKADLVVVVSGDEKTPDDVYLRTLNPQTLVIITPPPPVKKLPPEKM